MHLPHLHCSTTAPRATRAYRGAKRHTMYRVEVWGALRPNGVFGLGVYSSMCEAQPLCPQWGLHCPAPEYDNGLWCRVLGRDYHFGFAHLHALDQWFDYDLRVQLLAKEPRLRVRAYRGTDAYYGERQMVMSYIGAERLQAYHLVTLAPLAGEPC